MIPAFSLVELLDLAGEVPGVPIGPHKVHLVSRQRDERTQHYGIGPGRDLFEALEPLDIIALAR